MKLLILDTETTGLDCNTHEMVELAAVLYDTTSQTMIRACQSLFFAELNPQEVVNHISIAALQASKTEIDYRKLFKALASEADYILAHNKEFDRGFIVKAFGDDLGKPWVCTKAEIEYPSSTGSNKLPHLAVDHGVFVYNAHRALSDVMILMDLLRKVPDLEEQITDLPNKKLYYSKLPFEKKDLLKSTGFSFDPHKKRWTKPLTPAKFELLRESLMLYPVT